MEIESEKGNILKINQTNLENTDLTTKYLMENLDKTLIMFCNPISGNQEGKIFLHLGNHYLTKEKYKLIDFQYLLTNKKYEPIKVVIFELIDKEDLAKGHLLLKNFILKCKLNIEMGYEEKFQRVKTLIAGGDGTILSTIDNFVKDGIDLNYCIFGHVPLGTGNDLAKTLGFSDHINISETNINKLYKVLHRYYIARFGKIDIWKMDLQLDPIDGKVLVNTKDGKFPIKDDKGNIIKNYVRSFINYVSLGYDARIGYNFDRRRTTSRNGNKCIYVIEGLKKIFCNKTLAVQNFIETFTVYDNLDNSFNQESFFSDKDHENDINITNNNINASHNNLNANEHKVKFRCMTKKTFLSNKEKMNDKCLVFKGKPCSIIFQNIVNYMSGVENMWGKGKQRLTVGVKNGTEIENEKYTQKLREMAKSKQRFDDKMLEVFTFDNGFETGLEKLIRGLAKKVYHGRGPMEVKFLDTPKYEKDNTNNRIYLNLDGEYFHIVKPILMRIELNRDYCGGQLPFLIGDL